MDEKLIKITHIDQANIGERIREECQEYLLEDLDPEFKEPVLYPLKSWFDGTRASLTIFTARALGLDEELVLPAAATIELSYLYGNLISMIISGAEKFRGYDSLIKKYGYSIALLTTMYYREAISSAINDLPRPLQASRRINYALKSIIEGLKYKPTTLENYWEAAGLKSGILSESACILGASYDRVNNEILEGLGLYGFSIGIALQILEDINFTEANPSNVLTVLALSQNNFSKDNRWKDVFSLVKSDKLLRHRAISLKNYWVDVALKSLETISLDSDLLSFALILKEVM